MNKDYENDYPIVPGRSLVTSSATNDRISYLKGQGFSTEKIEEEELTPDEVRNNIESYVGTVKIPLGLAGPLLYNNGTEKEYVYALGGTLEGALLASINRGARVVSMSGGFNAEVIHQKMVRCPMLIFSSLKECVIFKEWINLQFEAIKQLTKDYSNHAQLQSIDPIIAGKSVHLKFVYSTGDASGQNMTTTCTWHAINWIKLEFVKKTNIEPTHCIVEGNGSSDKKVSHYSISQGRGIHVVAECELEEEYIHKILRTTSDDFVKCYNASLTMTRMDGMLGYNVNVANAIAAIFVATGQDLGSIHESSIGLLNVEKSEKGLYLSLHLPSLVIGTVGGGTHLPKQKEALDIMGCYGNGKVTRFAKIIAGYALSLEISTFAAIIGGNFATSHEKLGRNKPINWLTRSEINTNFIKDCIINTSIRENLLSIHFSKKDFNDNGILINITQNVCKKHIGFTQIETVWKKETNTTQEFPETLLIKSKAIDSEIIKGLNLMGTAIDRNLADLMTKHLPQLEYKNCHIKEIKLYEILQKNGIDCIPKFFGQKVDHSREIYFILQEFLNKKDILLINTENNPEKWDEEKIKLTIETIHNLHQFFLTMLHKGELHEIETFEPWRAQKFYLKMADIVIQQYDSLALSKCTLYLKEIILGLESEHKSVTGVKTIIHNDFNSRNIAVRRNGKICIYDWELAVVNFPQRDIVEFLSFTLPTEFDENIFINLITHYYNLGGNNGSWDDWKNTKIYCLKEYIVTRVLFYLTGNIVTDFEFSERIFLNANRMLSILQKMNTNERHHHIHHSTIDIY